MLRSGFECALLPAAGFGGAGCRLKQKIVLKQGRNVVGRASVTGNNMMKVSRRQLVLEWDKDRGVLRGCCGRQGRSTSFLLSPKKVRPVPGEDEGMAVLTNGDKVTFNVEHGVCQVQITGSIDESASPPLTPSVSWECSECANLNETGSKHCVSCGTVRYPTVLVTPPANPHWKFPIYDNQGTKAAVTGFFKAALQNIIKDVKANPSKPDPRVYFKTDTMLVAYDAYPKGVVHLLGFLLDVTINSVGEITSKHADAIGNLHRLGASIIKHLKATGTYKNYDFQMGYHCTPSLRPLHLHIMTTDLSSDCLKNRKHYSSFCPPYFIAASEVERRLAETGKVHITPTEAAPPTSGAMPCRWCGEGFGTIPMLKKHFETCGKNPNRV
eukprot:TRINITY_DN43470_c0_g1_i1.p1 TRINITY_DN43470_c0_g1~~TRINITY_DN43470_c0_g1_i1.p1  ORF type:complete len:383 (+),score=23.21 TRINITY_DN43470_c0_g1_i1:66-1214(+)